MAMPEQIVTMVDKGEYLKLIKEVATLRKQRDFLLESNNRLIEERRAAEANAAKAYVLLERAQERWQEALNKLQECRDERRNIQNEGAA